MKGTRKVVTREVVEKVKSLDAAGLRRDVIAQMVGYGTSTVGKMITGYYDPLVIQPDAKKEDPPQEKSGG